jgi:Tfp pilus assembly protein PilZ
VKNIKDKAIDQLLTEYIAKLTEDQKQTLLHIIKQTFFKERTHERKKYLSNVDYQWSGRSASGYIQNISASGLHLKPSESFEKGQEVTLTFQLPNKERYITVSGKISWRNQWGTGIKFNNLIDDLIES